MDDRDAAAQLKGSEIAISRAQLPALEEGDYYWHQLEGLSVYCGEELLGKIDHMLETGANDVMVVKPSEDSRDSQERLIPWLQGSVVTSVDVPGSRVGVDWDLEF